jgi:transposase
MATKSRDRSRRAGNQLASRKQFEAAWNSAPTIAAAAAQLGITVRNAYSRAFFLRKCGVQLKRFRVGRKSELDLPRKPAAKPEPEPDPIDLAQLPPAIAKFTTIWNGAASAIQAAAQLGITNRQASRRACYLRECGVALKKFRRGRQPLPKAKRKPKPRKRQRKLRPNAAEFVAVWNSASSVREVAERMRMTPHVARTMAWGYRREGLELQHFLEKIQGARVAAFAAIWNSSTTVEEAAERMGKPLDAIRSQAARIRSRGTSLKQLPSLADIRVKERVEKFVALWNASKSPAEVAAALGVGHQGVQNRASRLRKQGFVLKMFPPGFPAGSRRQTADESAVGRRAAGVAVGDGGRT